MSAFTTVLTVLIGIASLVLLAKNMWRKGNPSEHLPGIPLVEFDGDNSKERYIKYTDALVMKGYEQVSTGLPSNRKCSAIPDQLVLLVYKKGRGILHTRLYESHETASFPATEIYRGSEKCTAR